MEKGKDLDESLKNRKYCNWLERIIQHKNCFGILRTIEANLGLRE